MKVLHVASFHGNIGDNANHAGFRPWFTQLAGQAVEWLEFEIRDVYRRNRAFDMAFAEDANRADLVVIGGGNYFELWVKDLPTGTSIAIPDTVMDAIKAPIFVNALGVDDAQGYTDETLSKFRRFLGRLLDSPQYLVSVRNDGALASLNRHAADLPLERVLHLPDGGFFCSYEAAKHRNMPRIGINLAGDMLAQRFPGGDKLSYQDFLAEMAKTITQLWQARSDLHFTFFPHIFRDLAVCADLLALLPDRLRRDQIRVAAYDSGPGAADEVFGEYLACDAILAMRFHSNVVPIGHGVPTIGLFCYDQVKRLYDELKNPHDLVEVNKPGFSAVLLNKLNSILDQPAMAKAHAEAVRALVVMQRNEAGITVSRWLHSHGLT